MHSIFWQTDEHRAEAPASWRTDARRAGTGARDELVQEFEAVLARACNSDEALLQELLPEHRPEYC